MNELSPPVRQRVEAQGFVGLDDQTIDHINYWLRLSPAICMTWVAVGTAWSFQLGWSLTGHILRWGLVTAAFVNVSTGFCIPSFVYGLVFGKPTACNSCSSPSRGV